MCGIAGCYQQTDGESLVRLMGERIAHRGPDAYGLHSSTDDRLSVQLAHRRLSIIDLSAAADTSASLNVVPAGMKVPSLGSRVTTIWRQRGVVSFDRN